MTRKALLPFLLAAGVIAAPDLFPRRSSDDLLDRADLQAVVALQERRDTAGLLAGLASADAAVRARAAFGLGSVQARSAVPALLDALADPDAGVRADAAFALGQSADSAAAPRLLAALGRERDAATRRELIEALGKTGGRTSVDGLLKLYVAPVERPVVALALARYGIRGIAPTAALDRLISGVHGTDPGLRIYSAYYFGRVREAKPWAARAGEIRAALDALGGNDPAAMYLVLGLGRLGDTADTPRLIRRLVEPGDWRVRVNAARALGGRVDGPGEARVRGALLSALDLARSPGGAAAHVAVAAATALAGASLDSADLTRAERWVSAHPDSWQVDAALLPSLAAGGRVGSALRWMEGRTSVVQRARALDALARARDPASLRVLLRHAADSASATASAAIGALDARRRSGGLDRVTLDSVYATLLRGLARRDLAVRIAAANALADSAWLGRGVVARLEAVHASLTPPVDVEAMQAVEQALATLGARAPEAATGEPPRTAVDWALLRRFGPRPRLTLETDRGRVVLELDAEQAPVTVATVVGLAAAGRYDGVPFHRVVPNFVIQGGDFARGDGYGGPGFAIPSELTRIRYTRGTVGMASAGKDTEGSQYFVTHGMQPHLDGSYTAFGRVVQGMDVVDRIMEGDRVRGVRVDGS